MAVHSHRWRISPVIKGRLHVGVPWQLKGLLSGLWRRKGCRAHERRRGVHFRDPIVRLGLAHSGVSNSEIEVGVFSGSSAL